MMTSSDKLYIEFDKENIRYCLVTPSHGVSGFNAQRLMGVPGCRWLKGRKVFRVPRDLQTMRYIRKRVGQDAKYAPEIIAWAKDAQHADRALREIQMAPTADLPRFRAYNPTVHDRMRPDQLVGTKFISQAPSPLIADDPGLGKTWQVIAATVESDTHNKLNLVICPKISINSVWLKELNYVLDDPTVFVAPDGRRNREAMFRELVDCHDMDVPFWLVVNWSMITLRDGRFQFDEFGELPWHNVIIDEAHLTGLANPSTATAQGFAQLPYQKRIAMTGTPMGGKPMRLWGILHWLAPNEFNNSYQWGERWIQHFDMPVEGRTVKVWRGVKQNLEEEFARAHSPYIIRRLKSEVIHDRQEPHTQEIWVDMLPDQKKQYEQMDREAYIALEDEFSEIGRINSTSILSTTNWLKQFANGYCDLAERGIEVNAITGREEMKYTAMPTKKSPKLAAIKDILEELDMYEGSKEKVVLFTQFRRWANFIEEWFRKEGIRTALITGSVKQTERDRIQNVFQTPDDMSIQMVVCTTAAAGVSINLDQADTVIFVDETWDPDQQKQAMDRVDRASRNHLISVRYIRTRNSIEEDIQTRVDQKKDINHRLLDLYRIKTGEDLADQTAHG